MGRMGKSADKLEYVISEEEYKFYVLRDSIEEALGQEQYREVEQKLAEYEEYLMEEDVLHFQYLDMVRTFLVWTEEQKKQEAIAWLESAMDRTMPFLERRRHLEPCGKLAGGRIISPMGR